MQVLYKLNWVGKTSIIYMHNTKTPQIILFSERLFNVMKKYDVVLKYLWKNIIVTCLLNILKILTLLLYWMPNNVKCLELLA